MRTLSMGVLCAAALGCAPTPVVQLRVEPSAATRLDAAERQKGQTEIDSAKKQLVHAEDEARKAETERAGPAIDVARKSKELDAVMRAAEERKTAFVAWRRTQVEVARWQVAIAEAQLELRTAEAVSRTGAEIDPARFRAQSARLQEGRQSATKDVARARSLLDHRERRLAQEKERYAKAVVATPLSSEEKK